jgi:hypothetical protein
MTNDDVLGQCIRFAFRKLCFRVSLQQIFVATSIYCKIERLQKINITRHIYVRNYLHQEIFASKIIYVRKYLRQKTNNVKSNYGNVALLSQILVAINRKDSK